MAERSARDLGGWFCLAEIFEKLYMFFSFFGVFIMLSFFCFCDLAFLPLRTNFIVDNF